MKLLNVILLLAAGGCGANAPQPASVPRPAPRPAAPLVEEEGTNAAKRLDLDSEAMAQGLQTLQKAVRSGAETGVIGFGTLQGYLPQAVNGLARVSVTGETASAFGLTRSHARAAYAGGGAGVTVRIADLAAMGALGKVADLGWRATGVDRQTGTGFEKGISIGGYRGLHGWDRASGERRIQVIVGQRFMVEAAGTHAEAALLEAAVRAVRLEELAEAAGR